MATVPDRQERLAEALGVLVSELSLAAVLQRLTEIAVEITGARYGALGVLDSGGRIQNFVTVGVSPEERAAIGNIPEGKGILGVLITDPRPLRLADLHDHPASVGFPPRHPPMRSFLGAPVQARGTVYGNLYLTDKQGDAAFNPADEDALVLLAGQAGTAISNARLFDEAQRHSRWLDALREISSSILREVDPGETLALVTARARTVVGGDVAAVVATEPDPAWLRVAAADGDVAEALLGMTIPVEGSISGEVIRTGEAATLADAMAGSTPGLRPMIFAAHMGPALFVPFSSARAPSGVLAVGRHPGGARYSEEDAVLLGSFADQAALAIESMRAQQERRRLSLVEDRERIAKDLHDSVIQLLFAVGMSLEGTAGLVGDELLAQRLHEATVDIDRAISELRSYIFGLQPAGAVRRRLRETLDQVAHDFEVRSGVTTVVDVDAECEATLAPHTASLVQIVREALANVGKHAHATTCRITLRREGAGALLEIDDDGRGFVGQARQGMGLSNLQSRAAEVGAELSVSSTIGEGTAVRLLFPTPLGDGESRAD